MLVRCARLVGEPNRREVARARADITELVASAVQPLADRIIIRYRIHEHEPDGWFLVEQTAIATPANAFTAMDLVCSGFRPVAE